MRLVIATAVSALATTVAADAMMVYRNCEIPTVCHLYGAWYSGYGSFFVNAAEGCRGQGSGMVDFCMDWSNYRGHFVFSGQAKRCFARKGEAPASCYFTTSKCKLQYFEEVVCTW